MKRRPQLTTSRAVEIFREMTWFRREICYDTDFFRMTEVWETLCNDIKTWSIRPYKTKQTEDTKREAGIVVFGEHVTLTADERLLENAKRGCKFSNFILAHELGHLVLGHHRRSAIVKNFQLASGPSGMSNSPPTVEELEANFAAVFFQCGVALEDPAWNSIQLAHRAYSDVYYVKKAQSFVRLGVFQQELKRQETKFERVVL